MKRYIFIGIVIIFGHFYSNAQTITIKEMVEKINCKDFNQFNDFIIKKGFYYKGETKISIDEIDYDFSSSEQFVTTSNTKLTTSNTITVKFKNKKCYHIIFRTQVLNYYEALITQFKNLGFIGMEAKMISDYHCSYNSEVYKNIFFGVFILEPSSTREYGKIDADSARSYIIAVNAYNL